MKPDIGSNRTRGRLLVFATLLALRSWAATTAGTIQGSVVDDTGKPVAGARVLISLALTAAARPFPPPPVVTGPLVATVTADSRGALVWEVFPWPVRCRLGGNLARTAGSLSLGGFRSDFCGGYRKRHCRSENRHGERRGRAGSHG
jgi:hypothetical protein